MTNEATNRLAIINALREGGLNVVDHADIRVELVVHNSTKPFDWATPRERANVLEQLRVIRYIDGSIPEGLQTREVSVLLWPTTWPNLFEYSITAVDARGPIQFEKKQYQFHSESWISRPGEEGFFVRLTETDWPDIRLEERYQAWRAAEAARKASIPGPREREAGWLAEAQELLDVLGKPEGAVLKGFGEGHPQAGVYAFALMPPVGDRQLAVCLHMGSTMEPDVDISWRHAGTSYVAATVCEAVTTGEGIEILKKTLGQ